MFVSLTKLKNTNDMHIFFIFEIFPRVNTKLKKFYGGILPLFLDVFAPDP